MVSKFFRLSRNLAAQTALDAPPAPDTRNLPLVFMHIPKTAGTSLVSALREAVQPRREVSGSDLCLSGTFTDFASMAPHERARTFHRAKDMPADADLIAGHMALSTLRQAYPRARFMTVLRDPFSRLLSHWLYWRQMGEEELQPVGGWAAYVRTSQRPLEQFLSAQSIAFQIDNLALRMLLWPDPRIAADRFIDPADDEALIWEAAKRLHDFDFVDIVESEDLQRNLETWLDCALPFQRLNETGRIPEALRSPLHRELTSAAHDALFARSRLDSRLWQMVAAMRLHGADVAVVRERVILSNVARYSTIMAP